MEVKFCDVCNLPIKKKEEDKEEKSSHDPANNFLNLMAAPYLPTPKPPKEIIIFNGELCETCDKEIVEIFKRWKLNRQERVKKIMFEQLGNFTMKGSGQDDNK